MIRGNWGLTSDRDQQIGGLLMWVPMCAIYATAILAQLARWHSSPQPEQSHAEPHNQTELYAVTPAQGSDEGATTGTPTVFPI